MSLRTRLLVGMAVVAVVLVAASVAITRTTRDHLVGQVDDQLRSVGPPGRIVPPPAGSSDEGDTQGLSQLFFAVVQNGVLRTQLSPNLTGERVPPPDVTVADALDRAVEGRPFTAGSVGSSARYRVLAREDRRADAVLVLALPLRDVDATIERLVTVEAIATLSILAVLALVTWWTLRLGVRPIKDMTATATAIADGDLSQRVDEAQAGTEAGALGAALNQMLANIQEAFDQRAGSEERLRQFIADASHELRTPVTTIRGYAELFRAGGLDDPDELREAMRRTEQEAVRMGAVVDDLLLLARLDQGRPLDRAPVELDMLVDDAVRDARAVQPERPISLVLPEPAGVIVSGDADRLRQVLANLVGNVLVHTPVDVALRIALAREGGRAVIQVADEGPGMDQAVAARAFERFYRADPARSRHAGGSGLGLAIVQAIVAAHGGSASIDSAPGRGTCVRVELPLASAG